MLEARSEHRRWWTCALWVGAIFVMGWGTLPWPAPRALAQEAEVSDDVRGPDAGVVDLESETVEQEVAGELVRIEAAHYVHRSAVEEAQRIVLDLFRKAPSFTTMDFRDALGVSRKFAVPLLDYLDRTRFTVRTGNQRTPGAEARARLG